MNNHTNTILTYANGSLGALKKLDAPAHGDGQRETPFQGSKASNPGAQILGLIQMSEIRRMIIGGNHYDDISPHGKSCPWSFGASNIDQPDGGNPESQIQIQSRYCCISHHKLAVYKSDIYEVSATVGGNKTNEESLYVSIRVTCCFRNLTGGKSCDCEAMFSVQS